MIILIVKQHYKWIKKYIQKTVKHLRWSFLLEIASGWNPLAITANLSDAWLKRRMLKSTKHLGQRSFRNSQRLKSANFPQETPPQSFNRVLNVSLDWQFYWLNNFKGTAVPCLFNLGLFCLINKDSDTFL